MNVGWLVPTPQGFRIYESRTGRFFRDVASARCRQQVVYKSTSRSRGCATRRRDPYLRHWEHLDWSGPRKVRSPIDDFDGAA